MQFWPFCGVRPEIHSFDSPAYTENDRMPKYSFIRDSSQMKFHKININSAGAWVSIQTILVKDGKRPVSRNVDVDEVCTSGSYKCVGKTPFEALVNRCTHTGEFTKQKAADKLLHEGSCDVQCYSCYAKGTCTP